LALAGLLSGCVVESQKPFYSSRDLIVDRRFVGVWEDPQEQASKDRERWVIQPQSGKAYLAKCLHPDGTQTSALLHLFRLGKALCADYQELESQDNPPRHQLLRIDSLGDRMVVRSLKHARMRDYLREHPAALAHTFSSDKDDAAILLTADTRELQAFMKLHLDDPSFFGEPGPLVRHREETKRGR